MTNFAAMNDINNLHVHEYIHRIDSEYFYLGKRVSFSLELSHKKYGYYLEITCLVITVSLYFDLFI